MLIRALLVWLGILLLASLNGALRDFVLTPRFGDPVARAVSTVLLSVVVLLVTWWTIRWIGPSGPGRALAVGLVWVLLTLGFEFLAGHYLFHKPWRVLLEDYNLRRGRIWVLVLVVTMIAPLWMARLRGILRGW